MTKKDKIVTVYLHQEDYLFLDKQVRAMDPNRKKGFARTTVFWSLFKALIIALHRPQHYTLVETLYHMCLAAVPPEDEEGQQLIIQQVFAKSK